MNNLSKVLQILQKSALASSSLDQILVIIESITQLEGVKSCALFRKNELGDMELLVCRGGFAKEGVIIPAGKGLVGVVAQSLRPVKIKGPVNHPDYVQGECYASDDNTLFLGIPLVKLGYVVGVLVIQFVNSQYLTENEEAFMLTLASHVALIVFDILSIKKVELNNISICGVKGAPGIGIGKVRCCYHDGLNDVSDTSCEDVEGAIIEWHLLLGTVITELKSERAAMASNIDSPIKSIFDAYLMILSDAELRNRVEAQIRLGNALPTALRNSIHYFSEVFKAMEDPYLKTRSEDILHLGNKLFNSWLGSVPEETYSSDGCPLVLVGKYVSISDIANISAHQLAGIVCLEGSSLSHTAVLANALGVPAVMGVDDIKCIRENEQVIVDGNSGQVITCPTTMVIKEYRRLVDMGRGLQEKLDSLKDVRAITKDNVVIQLFANTGLLADMSAGLNNGAEGIGLYRTEIPFMIRDSFPSEDEQTEIYRSVLSAYSGKPVYMRTLDIGGDKPLPYFQVGVEENPALGWRGVRFTLDNIHLLMMQLRAMLRAAEGIGNLHIILPMVSSTRELILCRQLLDDAFSQLKDEGIAVDVAKMGIMVEVPAAISQLRFWKNLVDFISIGSNDLSQYILALDRNNGRVASYYDHVHPAVLYEINRIVDIARDYDLPVSLCGEMASDPVAVLLLLGMGIRTFSLSSTNLPKIKWLIRSMSIDMSENMLGMALKMNDIQDIKKLGYEVLSSLGLNDLIIDKSSSLPAA